MVLIKLIVKTPAFSILYTFLIVIGAGLVLNAGNIFR